MASQRLPNERNGSNSQFYYPDSSSTFTCSCGLKFHSQIALDNHKKTQCHNRGFTCELCDEKLENSDALGIHLLECANKTNKCPNCKKFIRRAFYLYHLENSCIDIDIDSSQLFDEEDLRHNRDTQPAEATYVVPINDYLQRTEITDRELVNEIANTKAASAENSISSLHMKIAHVQEALCKEYYPIEVSQLTERQQFNIIVMGSPRVGKSQLINAICNGEMKAETSASLNSCTKQIQEYVLEHKPVAEHRIRPFQVIFYDTPGIESWTNDAGKTTMLQFIEEKDPVCVIYCAGPGTFADLAQVRPVLQFCKEKKIFWAFACTNMWSNRTRNEVIDEFRKELAIFGEGTEKLFAQAHSHTPHKVIVYSDAALCTMVNSIEYHDPEMSTEKKPVQGVDELIHCIMEALHDEKLLGWCNAVLYRRSYWEKLGQKAVGFLSLHIDQLRSIAYRIGAPFNIH